MTTTITPALGQGAVMNQATSYDAISARRFWGAGLQEGILSSGSFEVTQRGAGANLTVDIAASTGDGAIVQGDAVTAQGPYHVPAHTAVINEAITTAHASLPRIDQVVLELKDHTHDASGLNLAQVRVVAGTATSGATLTNRTGAAALPSSALRLADVLVGAAAASVTNAVIRDRRPWAVGAYCRVARSTDASTTSTSLALVDSTGLQPRIECSGVPLVATLRGWRSAGGTPASRFAFALFLDGAVVTGTPVEIDEGSGAGANAHEVNLAWHIVPGAGSHTLGPAFATQDGDTLVLNGGAGSFVTSGDIVFTVEEIVRPNAANNATTSG